MSAPQPHQVSGMTWRFAGPTSGIMARAHSSLDSPRFDLAVVCRMRNDVDDLLREPLKHQQQLQQPGRHMPASGLIMFPCCRQTVRSAVTPTERCHDTLPGADRVCCLLIARVCTGGGSYSKVFVVTAIFTSGRSLQAGWSLQRTGAARTRRFGFAASASTWLTVSQAHDSMPDFK